MTTKKLTQFITKVIDENHGEAILVLDVRKLSGIADYMVICSTNSERHLKALAEHVIYDVKREFNLKPLGSTSATKTDWTLVDFGDVIVHIMLPSARAFYELEKLWQKVPTATAKTKRKSNHKSKPKAAKTKRKQIPVV